MRHFTIRQTALAGLVAAIYAVLSLVFQPISFGVYQVRIAEALTVLPFLAGAAVPGLFIGCLLANILGGMGWLDIVIGPLITLAAGILTWYSRRLGKNALVAGAVPIAIALMWVGAVYLLTSFDSSSRIIAGVALSVVGLLPVVLVSLRKPKLNAVIKERFWTWSTVSLIVAVISIPIMKNTDEFFFFICGSLLLVAAVFSSVTLTWLWLKGENASVLLAPLPPVVLNAFGVSAYLAGIIGVDYWFCVQMIGVGQLIACYALGLPILLILKRRNIFG
ncbi:MAG: QueT transporter family protein [candidate division Zixibacteria bacterium]|nr:QueT transporter family protein [candidate division Zixibacteria bacterium]